MNWIHFHLHSGVVSQRENEVEGSDTGLLQRHVTAPPNLMLKAIPCVRFRVTGAAALPKRAQPIQ